MTTTTNTMDFGFLDNKIEQLGTALFSSDSLGLLKFSVCVIQVARIDEAGNIIFSLEKHYKDMRGSDEPIPAHLRFYNKDLNYYIEAGGIASIMIGEQAVSVSFKMTKAECFYTRKNEPVKLRAIVYKLVDRLFERRRPGQQDIFDYAI